MFRIADVRATQVINPKISAYLYSFGEGRVTAEGERTPVRVEPLKVLSFKACIGVFALLTEFCRSLARQYPRHFAMTLHPISATSLPRFPRLPFGVDNLPSWSCDFPSTDALVSCRLPSMTGCCFCLLSLSTPLTSPPRCLGTHTIRWWCDC